LANGGSATIASHGPQFANGGLVGGLATNRPQGIKYSAGPAQVKLKKEGAPQYICDYCDHSLYSNSAAMANVQKYPAGVLHMVANPKPLAERAAGEKRREKCGGRLVRQAAVQWH
jgi:hypothetical protein